MFQILQKLCKIAKKSPRSLVSNRGIFRELHDIYKFPLKFYDSVVLKWFRSLFYINYLV